ncbi:plexin-B1/SEP receptor-like [Scleropages formosus]|uniref:Plexin-B1 n=1 Tax=Scleropages formosus TaxID=113540 RepID=A0A0P7XJD2_SCLFO|nr:plexin-B1/SEP receptor-like [Scleropages formosus]
MAPSFAVSGLMLLSLLWGSFGVPPDHIYLTFSRNDTSFQHLALHPDPSVGTVYIGAQDRLFQLNSKLVPVLEEITGPVMDSKDCLPPVTESNCPQARRTSNHNKLLLVNPYSQELISCGSVNQGICQKRSLDSIQDVLFSTKRPVDTQYVAANDPLVSTVGLVVQSRGRLPVLFVGRGYTSSHPPISTRNLASEPVFSYEETAKLAVAGRLSEYDHHFVKAFSHGSHVYFLFCRRDIKSQSREYKTYISRVCLDDTSYYSYVEVPLVCRSPQGNSYSLLQAACVGLPNGGPGSKVLLGVFSTRLASSSKPGEDSALCVFPLEELDKQINSTRDLCYTQDGRTEGGVETAYIEYEVKSNCANLPLNTLAAYPCGSDHTPSPMASRVPVEAAPVFYSPAARLTAVAVSVRDGHAIAFLGDSKGNLHKVFLGPSGEVEEYSTVLVQANTAISGDLFLDQAHENLFIMTSHTVEKRPVAECHDHSDCLSCLSARDPYCGWCVLEGRCGLRGECTRGEQLGQWLWSFQREQRCLEILSLSPANISREERRDVFLSVPGLPSLAEEEEYSCFFQGYESPATVTEAGITCSSPEASQVPSIPTGKDSTTVILSLRFLNVTVATTEFTFYDCSAIQQLSGSMPCRGCVHSRWGCHWCVHQHLCTHKSICEHSAIIYNEQEGTDDAPETSHGLAEGKGHEMEANAESDTTVFSATVLSGDGDADQAPAAYSHLQDPQYDSDYYLPGDEGVSGNMGSSACPCVETVQGSTLLPVGVERKITLIARNLHLFQDEDYECELMIEGQAVVVDAYVEVDDLDISLFYITCQLHEYSYSASLEEYNVVVHVKRRNSFHLDSAEDLHVTLYNCSVGRSDCSRCRTAHQKYGCVWCGGTQARCIYRDTCANQVESTCPAPLVHFFEPLSGPLEGGTAITITGSNLGQKAQDIQHSVTVAGLPCSVLLSRYEVSSRIVCVTSASMGERSGLVSVEVTSGGYGLSSQKFSYQDPVVSRVSPLRGPKAGGTLLLITGRNLLTGHLSEVCVFVGDVPCLISSEVQENRIECRTGVSNRTGEHRVTVRYGSAERHLLGSSYHYTLNPNITFAAPSKSFLSGGRMIHVSGHNLDVVQEPHILVTVSPLEQHHPTTSRRRRRSRARRAAEPESLDAGSLRHRRIVPEPGCPKDVLCIMKQYTERCQVNTSTLILCPTPTLEAEAHRARVQVEFLLDNLRFDFASVSPTAFSYEVNPTLHQLNHHDPSKPYRYKPGSIISVEGENLDLAIFKEEVVALIGEGVCSVKTLTRNHLYCEPPALQPLPGPGRKRDGTDALPEFIVLMGNLNFSLGKVQYDIQSLSTFPLEAQIGVGVGASIVALIVLIIVLIYRRKSKQALRDYKKVQIQLENLETSVRDRCKKEFTDLMTEMMDMSSDLVGSGIPFLDYRMYAERIFFPGHRESPLHRDLDVQECRRQTVEQGLVQLSNLLNSKLFLTKFIHTLESQRTFSPRDRAYVASLLTVALHGKLEYFTDILRTLLNDLVEQYVAKNPKLMLRRTESVVEKLLTNWMSICLYAFLRDSAGESLYMLFRAIKHQVDKGPVDAITGKAKYTLNDNRLLRDDIEYHTLTLNVLMQSGSGNEAQSVPSKVLDCDTITQVKEKILDQVYKGTPFSHRPHTDSLDLEWRSGVAGHLILSDEDLTSVVQGSWKRLNTLQHYKVPDGATVALVPRLNKHIHHDSHDYVAGEKTPMLEDADEGGVKLWHLVKASEETELPRHRRGSLKERERAKAIPEIYLTRLLSMKGTLQKFVDDLFQVVLSTSRPVPLAVKYFFDLLDEHAAQHGITDPETIHIWKTNSLPLRFWINIIKNPQFIFDVQASDNVDAVLSVIAQTFMDSCTIAEHKLGRDSPINKLLYARDIPRYKQMVERYYADIRQTISASDQEMNSALAELSRNYSGELNYLVALHELYKYINKYYDQIITALEEDTTAQKMQLGYRLQQIAAAVENKVTDL